MFRIMTAACLLLVTISALAQKKVTTTKQNPPSVTSGSINIKTTLDSFSYSIGVNIASNLKEEGIDTLNEHLLATALKEVLSNKTLRIDLATANLVVQKQLALKSQEKMNRRKLAGLNYLSENKKRKGVQTSNSGLQYEVIQTGSGKVPVDSSTVSVHFKSALLDEKIFDSSTTEKPAKFRLTDVIPGWSEALKLMPAGSKWKIYVPFYLAYSDNAVPPHIPAGSSLVFYLELLEVY